jgi:hypothetical protein
MKLTFRKPDADVRNGKEPEVVAFIEINGQEACIEIEGRRYVVEFDPQLLEVEK